VFLDFRLIRQCPDNCVQGLKALKAESMCFAVRLGKSRNEI
jgi:hypothetical protein